MRRILYGFVVAGLIFSVVSCAQGQQQVPSAQQGLLVDDFEGAITGGPDGTVDYGAGNGSAVTVTADTGIKNTGSQSIKVAYDSIQDGYMYIARGFGLDARNTAWLVDNKTIDWKVYNAFSFFMYGSGSKAQVAFDIKDSGNEIWRFMVTDDFSGWNEIVCAFTDFFPRGDWQPDSADKNAQLDFPVKSFQFEPRTIGTGTLYFDTVKLIKK